MCLNEIFYNKLREISFVSGVEEKQIMSHCKEIDVVDARHILIKVMMDYGMSVNIISKHLSLSKRTIQYAYSNFESRLKYSKWARRTYEIVTKQ